MVVVALSVPFDINYCEIGMGHGEIGFQAGSYSGEKQQSPHRDLVFESNMGKAPCGTWRSGVRTFAGTACKPQRHGKASIRTKFLLNFALESFIT